VNTENEKFNEELTKLQSRVKIAYRQVTEPKDECCLMRINNYREVKIDNESEHN
jgi:hypothetical protein